MFVPFPSCLCCARKRATSEIRTPFHAKTLFFKVRSHAGAGRKKHERHQKRSKSEDEKRLRGRRQLFFLSLLVVFLGGRQEAKKGSQNGPQGPPGEPLGIPRGPEIDHFFAPGRPRSASSEFLPTFWHPPRGPGRPHDAPGGPGTPREAPRRAPGGPGRHFWA